MPISFFEGVRVDELSDDGRRPSLERRFRALAAAVRDHESRVRGSRAPAREDEALYRRLRQLSGEPVTSEHGAA